MQTSAQSGSRTWEADGWKSVQERERFEELWVEQDQHDEDLKLDSVLCKEALQRLDTGKERDAPHRVVSGEGSRVLTSVDPEAPFLLDYGTVVGGVDPWHDDDADSCVPGCTGSSCRSEWELEQDDFGDGSRFYFHVLCSVLRIYFKKTAMLHQRST